MPYTGVTIESHNSSFDEKKKLRADDHILDGSHNFEVDRQVADHLIKLMLFIPKKCPPAMLGIAGYCRGNNPEARL